MATIDLQNVEKKFGEVYAVQPLNLTIENGEFVVRHLEPGQKRRLTYYHEPRKIAASDPRNPRELWRSQLTVGSVPRAKYSV